MPTHEKIEAFLHGIRKRVGRQRLIDRFAVAAAAGGALLLAVSLGYVALGYAVPAAWWTSLPPAALLAGLIWWLAGRPRPEDAARRGDAFFGLKDALASWWEFRGRQREGGFYELHAAATAEAVAARSPDEIRYRWPRRVLGAAAVLAAACALLALRPPSPEMLERWRVEEETAAKTVEINEALEEMLEDLARSLEEDGDFDGIDPQALREWALSLAATEDRDEAMRQYAGLESKLQEAARRLEQRREEQLVARVGEALRETEDAGIRALGRKLEEKKLREAAADLAALEPEAARLEALGDQRRELARLRAAAQRMASAAAAAGRSGSSAGGEGASSRNSGAKPGVGNPEGGGGQGDGGGGGESLEDLLAGLDQATRDLDSAMAAAEREMARSGECSAGTMGRCASAGDSVRQRLSQVERSLCRMAARDEYRSRLLSLCRAAGQCQGYLGNSQADSLGQCLGNGTNPGGLEAGQGSVESRREGGSGSLAAGELSRLHGLKGAGPSESSVQAADDGDGVATRQAVAREREFQRQTEAFVQREDVPDNVKDGVREYFRLIHRSE